jgi:hypothetical protein
MTTPQNAGPKARGLEGRSRRGLTAWRVGKGHQGTLGDLDLFGVSRNADVKR